MLTSRINQSGLRATQPGHIQAGSNSPTGSLTVDNQNPQVDMSREMADLAENQIRYEFVSRALKQYYAGLSSAILGRTS